MELTPSVVHRGKAWGRITAEDYDEAIQDLQQAKTQLQPDGDNCHVCHDSGHQAWECHHNPLAMAREASKMRYQWGGIVLAFGLFPVCRICRKPEMNCDCDVPFEPLRLKRTADSTVSQHSEIRSEI